MYGTRSDVVVTYTSDMDRTERVVDTWYEVFCYGTKKMIAVSIRRYEAAVRWKTDQFGKNACNIRNKFSSFMYILVVIDNRLLAAKRIEKK